MKRNDRQGFVQKTALRCAIYTRVSTDAGLEQEFNSLDNQREASEAYIKSQAHEGWKLIRDRYDDGGFSGGSMERPALTKLLDDVRAHRVDVIVVYKVDRLTRSLADFAKLVELFDAQSVSFVSVTQAFNTTTSMGRLTLNVLLSFAQFEREVTGERIRDKIAASKRKGMWMGGVVPLGYEVRERKLVVNEVEAATVRLIFSRYIDLESLPALQRDLRERGIVTRTRTLSSGRLIGGRALTNGPLAYLLRNRMYLGEINHRDQSHPGEHMPIIAPEVFEAVQARLTENRRGRRLRRQDSQALLLGKLFDDCGNRMTPSYAIKKGVRYRYYVSCVLAQGRKEDAGSVARIAATAIELKVAEAVRDALARDPVEEIANSSNVTEANRTAAEDLSQRLRGSIERVTIGKASLAIQLSDDAVNASDTRRLVVPWSPPSSRRRRDIIHGTVENSPPPRTMRIKARSAVLVATRNAHRWLDELMADRSQSIETLASREGKTERSVRMTLSLAFVAPPLIAAAIDGRLSRGFGVKRLIDLPMLWSEQWTAVGLKAPAR